MNTLYVMKEQLQALWSNTKVEVMEQQLEQWCELADQTNMTYIKRFAKSLRKHKTGICNYAKYQLTSARIEGGSVSIGMIRKRARGIRDTEYFKLKIRQTSVSDTQSMFYILYWSLSSLTLAEKNSLQLTICRLASMLLFFENGGYPFYFYPLNLCLLYS